MVGTGSFGSKRNEVSRAARLGSVVRQFAPVAEIEGREVGAGQRPFLLFAPMATVIQAPIRRLVPVTTAHDEDAHRRILGDLVLVSLEPVIEVTQVMVVHVGGQIPGDRCLRPELDVARPRQIGLVAAVRPWTHHQADRSALPLGEANEVLQRGARVGVVPGAGEEDRHVGVPFEMLLEIETRLLPILVVVATRPDVEDPALVHRHQRQRRHAGFEGQAPQPVPKAHLAQGAGDRWVFDLCAGHQCSEAPGHEAHLEGAVVAHRTGVRVGASLIDVHGRKTRRIERGQRVLHPGKI